MASASSFNMQPCACARTAVVGGTARVLLSSARLLLHLQVAAHRAGASGLRAVVLSERYAALCSWLQQLAASGGAGAGVAAFGAPHAFARGLLSSSVPNGSSCSKDSAGSATAGAGWASRLLGWGWLRGRGGEARSGLSSHPLQPQALRPLRTSFDSHPLCASSFSPQRMSMDLAEQGNNGGDGGGAPQGGQRGQGPALAQQPQRRAGRGIGRRLVARGATFALRAAALPLMHCVLRAYAAGEGGPGQQRRLEEEEEAEAAAQVSVFLCWLEGGMCAHAQEEHVQCGWIGKGLWL